MTKPASIFSALVFGLSEIFLFLITAEVIFGSIQGFTPERRWCGTSTPLEGAVAALVIGLLLLFIAFRGWKAAQNNKFGEKPFHIAFILSRSLLIAAVIFISAVYFYDL